MTRDELEKACKALVAEHMVLHGEEVVHKPINEERTEHAPFAEYAGDFRMRLAIEMRLDNPRVRRRPQREAMARAHLVDALGRSLAQMIMEKAEP